MYLFNLSIHAYHPDTPQEVSLLSCLCYNGFKYRTVTHREWQIGRPSSILATTFPNGCYSERAACDKYLDHDGVGVC